MSIKISQFTSIPAVDGTNLLPIVSEPSPTNFSSYKVTVSDLQTFILQGNAATATNLAASTDTLASTVLYSSLTSVGTLLNLTVTNTISGDIDGNAATATNLAASTDTLASTVLYSSLTSVGTLLDLTVTNTITGSVSGNAGTVTNGVYTTDTGTVTNTMLAGSIDNSKLSNSSITVNGVEISLGSSGSITTAIAPATTSVIGGVIVGEGLAVDVDGVLSVAITKLFHGFSVNADGDLIYSTTTDSTINLQDQYGDDIYETVDIGTDEYSYSMDGDGNLIVTFA